MSSYLRSKSYVFRNQQLSRAEYLQKIKLENLSSYQYIQKLKDEYVFLKLNTIHKFAKIKNTINSSGNNIDHAKNAKFCFDTSDGTEDCKFIFWGGIKTKDAYDTDAFSLLNSAYEIFDVGVGVSNCYFGSVVYSCA